MESKEKQKKVLLVVEDDPLLGKAYQSSFGEVGYEVYVARDGESALKYLEEDYPVDAVILDLLLPGINGFEVLEKLRKNEKRRHVPVLIVSNLDEPEDQKKGEGLGAQGFEVKAKTNMDSLIKKVNLLLGLK